MKKVIIVLLMLSFCICLSCPMVYATETDGGGFSGGWGEDEEDLSFAWNDNMPVNAWNVCVYILRIGFVFGYRVLNELMMITDTVSAWDFIILCALVSGILGMLSQSYGGGTSGSGSSADGALSKRNRKNSDE